MKLTVNAGDLSSALQGPCARARPQMTIPILKHVRFQAADGRLDILGTDLDSSCEAAVDAEVAVAGACAMPAEPFSRLLSGIYKAASVSIEVGSTDAVVKSGRSRYKFPVLSADDMPPALSAKDGAKFPVTADDLDRLFVKPRAAVDQRYPSIALQGFYLHPENGKLCSAGTDSYVMMRFETGIDAGEFRGVIVPKSAADEIVKFGPGELVISDRIISISSARRTYASKLIDSTFPEAFRRIVDSTLGEGITATVDRDSVVECLGRLRSAGDFSENELIDIAIDSDELTISSVGTAEGSETIECESSAKAFICLKVGQLMEAIKVAKADRIQFRMPVSREPFRIIDPSEPSGINLLMPCGSRNARRNEAA